MTSRVRRAVSALFPRARPDEAVLAFHPALLRLQEQPPAPLPRAVLLTLLVLLAVLLTWSVVGRVDVVAVAQGRVVPSGHLKVLQPIESGIVRAIHVREGQRVAQGDLLIELDPAVSVADVKSFEQRIVKGEKTLALVEEKAASYRSLLNQGMVARTTFLEVEEQRVAAEQDLAALRQELVKAREREAWQRLTAPVAGTVQQLAVHTVGGVVTPAQPLVTILPEGEALEVEAWLPNKDIGFVSEGQSARVKVDAFPFTRFGMLEATIRDVSDDAVENEALGWVYTVRAALATPNLDGSERPIGVSSGMTVTLEIQTDRRRIIEYFLSPIQRHASESMRER